ncbi:D-alanyl-D-alanine carboxypeptidase [Patescibacteria group bacterium]|nr:D-alanyl-D-alanine carboxypeptidase [Patescibacteria group bacterium]
MKTVAIFLIVINFFTGSLNSIKDSLISSVTDPAQNPLRTLATALKPEPVRNPLYKDPTVRATSAIVVDADTGKVLLSKNPDERLAIASITKIMTAMVVLRYKTNLENTLTVSGAAAKVGGSQMYLLENETMTIKNLMKGMLIDSANDAAYALAEGTFGNVDRFVDAMDRYANELGLTNTHFTNSYGADDVAHFSTARELATLTAYAMKNEIFRSIVSIQKTTVTDITGKIKHNLENTNKLIGKYLNVIGVKTGTTEEAGASLVVAAKGNSNQTVIAVLLNSPARFEEGQTLLDWALKAYTWIEPL